MREGWRETTLSEVAEIIMGQSPPGVTYNENGEGMPFIQGSAEFGERSPRPVKWCSEPRKVARPGDCLVSVRAPVGDLNIAATETCIGRGLAIVRPQEDVDKDFLGFLIEGSVQSMKSASTGGMFESITKAALSSVSVHVPPFAEQRRVADLLAHVDEVIAKEREAEARLRNARASLLADLLGDRRAAREGWDAVLLGDVASPASGNAFPRKEQGSENGFVPFIKVSDMNSPGNEVAIGGAKNWLSKDQAKKLKVRIHEPGTVIFPKVGAALKTEKRRILGAKAAFDNNVMGLTCGPRLKPDFLLLKMQTVRLADHVQEGAVPSVNNRIINGIPIRLPELAEQERLAGVFLSADETINAQVARNMGLLDARSALLSVLLSGEHEIPESYDRFLAEAA